MAWKIKPGPNRSRKSNHPPTYGNNRAVSTEEGTDTIFQSCLWRSVRSQRMFAHYLIVEEADQLPRHGEYPGHIVDPTLDDIRQAVLRFDGNHVRLVIVAEAPLTPDSELPFAGRGIGLAVAVGHDGLSAVYHDGVSDREYYACDMRRSPGKLVDVVSGQLTDRREYQILPQSVILDIVCEFARTGKLLACVEWCDSKGNRPA